LEGVSVRFRFTAQFFVLAVTSANFLVSLPLLLCDETGFSYEKATEGSEVVMRKLYPKNRRLELDAKLGFILNQSYLNSILLNGGLSYFFSEEWGFNGELTIALNSDKPERECIEQFYNDPNFQVGPECGPPENLAQDAEGKANFGPAYVPIRELQNIITANFVWNPIYGKQIILLSAVNYFDFFVSMGGGLASSNYYPLSTTLINGATSRGEFVEGETPPGTTDTAYIGKGGRPTAASQSNVVLHLTIGQRFHFLGRLTFLAELKNYTLVGTEAGFDNFTSLVGGFGIRL
jgi:outer membrane beta-barrel protein